MLQVWRMQAIAASIDCSPMEFTGERYMPSLTNAQITYEHWHRYVFTKDYIQSKVVLDIACGEGYGAYYMAGHAEKVIGIDVSQEAIDHAGATYQKENLQFLQSNAAAVAISESGFADVVVSFETIEHIPEEQQHLFLQEIKRLLKPGGVLIMSTPDKAFYSDVPGYQNQYHLKEFYGTEYDAFLKSAFQHTMLLQQNLFPVSFIWTDAMEVVRPCYINFVENRYVMKDIFSSAPMYFIALCSDAPLEKVTASVLVDENATLHAELTNMIIARDHLVAALRSELHVLQQQFNGLKNERASTDVAPGTTPNNQMLQR
jgi:2-polyprenyl-3-methyl-5-hydroxy-6-metoxy-1,4-benzoquinol methylase